MAQPVFAKADSKLQGVFTANDAALIMSPAKLGALVQGVQFSFTQAVQRLYEINWQRQNFANVYYGGGRSQGQCGLNRIVGPNAAITTLYSKYGDVCQASTNPLTLDLSAGNCMSGAVSTTSLSYTLKFCVLTQVGLSVQAQDMIINESAQIMFSGLDYAGNV